MFLLFCSIYYFVLTMILFVQKKLQNKGLSYHSLICEQVDLCDSLCLIQTFAKDSFTVIDPSQPPDVI